MSVDLHIEEMRHQVRTNRVAIGPTVNFIKNSNPKHSFVIFGAKILFEKHAHKMLMKLTPNLFYTSGS